MSYLLRHNSLANQLLLDNDMHSSLCGEGDKPKHTKYNAVHCRIELGSYVDSCCECCDNQPGPLHQDGVVLLLIHLAV